MMQSAAAAVSKEVKQALPGSVKQAAKGAVATAQQAAKVAVELNVNSPRVRVMIRRCIE